MEQLLRNGEVQPKAFWAWKAGGFERARVVWAGAGQAQVQGGNGKAGCCFGHSSRSALPGNCAICCFSSSAAVFCTSVYSLPLFHLWAEAIESFLVLFYYIFSEQPSDALAFCLQFAHFVFWLKMVLVSMQLQTPAKHSLFCALRVFLAWWVPHLLYRLCSLNWRKGKGCCQLSQKAYFLPRRIEIVLVCVFFYWKPDLCELA